MVYKKHKFPKFLMKHGWVILLLLLIYGTFAFFDAVPPFNQDYCKFSDNVKCIDLVYDDNQVQFALRNIGDYDYTDTKVILEDESESNTLILKEKEVGIYSINYNETRVIKGTVTFSYINSDSGLRHKEKGKFKLFT